MRKHTYNLKHTYPSEQGPMRVNLQAGLVWKKMEREHGANAAAELNKTLR